MDRQQQLIHSSDDNALIWHHGADLVMEPETRLQVRKMQPDLIWAL